MKKIRDTRLTTAEVAEILGYTTTGARMWLKRHNAAWKEGGRWVTSPSRLAAAFPEAFQELARG
jgi:hypothetical protein